MVQHSSDLHLQAHEPTWTKYLEKTVDIFLIFPFNVDLPEN